MLYVYLWTLPINVWIILYETWYIYHGAWANLSGEIHNLIPSLSSSILRPMVSRPVCLGVGPSLGLTARFFLFFSLLWQLFDSWSGTPFLTRGRVWSLQRSHSLFWVAQDQQPYFAVSFETPPTWSWSSSSSCGRQSINQFLLVSGSPLGPMTRFYLFFFRLTITLLFFLGRPLWREDGSVTYKCNRWLVRSLTTNNHTFPSHLRLCSLFVAF
jgi:hypothetical protein